VLRGVAPANAFFWAPVTVYLINPSDVSLGIGVVTPRGRAADAFVVFGGIHATLFPDEAHQRGGAHAVVTVTATSSGVRCSTTCARGQRMGNAVIEEIVALRRGVFRFIALADDSFYPVTRRWPHGGTTGPSLLTCAKAINGDDVAAKNILGRVPALRHLLQQVGHDV